MKTNAKFGNPTLFLLQILYKKPLTFYFPSKLFVYNNTISKNVFVCLFISLSDVHAIQLQRWYLQ